MDMHLRSAAQILKAGIDESLTYMTFPRNHWTRIRTNNVLERMNREIRRRTRVVGNFPDGRSALMLVSARLRHVAGTQWRRGGIWIWTGFKTKTQERSLLRWSGLDRP